MKVFVVLCSVLACVFAKPGIGYSYSAVAPLHYNYAPYSIWGVAAPMAYSAPLVHHSIAPVVAGVKSQYHTQDYFGHAAYGHIEPGQSHTAVQDASGNKVGTFSYVKPDGGIARTDYVADSLGYRVASNNLPVAPLETPMPVVDTPEVVAAKAAHFAHVAEVKMRAKRDVILPASTSPLVTPIAHHVVPVTRVAPAIHPIVTPLVHSTPIVHTPVVHTPVVHTPVVHTPVVHTPVVHTPLVHHVAPVVHHMSAEHLADTPEVTAAKIAHFAEVEKTKMRSKRALVYSPYSTATGYSYSHPLSYSARTYTPYSPYYYGHHLNSHYYI